MGWHLTARLAWHGDGWNGHVGTEPQCSSSLTPCQATLAPLATGTSAANGTTSTRSARW